MTSRSDVDLDGAESEDVARLLREQPGVQQVIDQLVGEALSATFCDSAGLVVTSAGKVVAAAATSAAARAADDLQWTGEEGPALQSRPGQTELRTTDVRGDSRWPHWGPRAADLGLASVVSLQLSVSRHTGAALTLYGDHLDAYGSRDLLVAESFGRYASVALTSAQERDAMLTAAETRQLVGIAEGILMQRHQLEAEAAFSSLRLLGAQEHSTLREAAERLCDAASSRSISG